ncbi:MAG: HAMP domain-containing histidine kinase [Bdellovibrionales bacterium]|nr:HAMP domain-containing histidine kinase [Bdellovibrionales bacterium]
MSTVQTPKTKGQGRYILVAVWLAFTVSLSIWWYLFSQRQISRLLVMDSSATAELAKDQRMLMWEGVVLIGSLLCGGGALTWLVYRDAKHAKQLRDFFLTFSHELKTPLANIRLAGDGLLEDTGGTALEDQVRQLISQTDKLHAQVENSLSLLQMDRLQLAREAVSLREIVRMLKIEFPYLELDLESERDCVVEGDIQAVTTVLRNLLRNAMVHGAANKVWISPEVLPSGSVSITVRDDGEGLRGSKERLGQPFQRLYPGSGSGLGLFISRRLIEHMGGRFFILEPETGFSLRFSLPGYLV